MVSTSTERNASVLIRANNCPLAGCVTPVIVSGGLRPSWSLARTAILTGVFSAVAAESSSARGAQELFDGGCLRRIDGGRRLHYVYHFPHFLLVRKRHFQVSRGRELHGG